MRAGTAFARPRVPGLGPVARAPATLFGAGGVCARFEWMSKLLSSIAERLRGYGKERRAAPRYSTHLEKQLSVNIFIPGIVPRAGDGRVPFIAGYTRDLSELGLGVVVSNLQIGGISITQADRVLLIKLKLPKRAVEMRAACVRHLETEEGGEKKHVLGIQIKKMSDNDRAEYAEFIKTLKRS